MKFEINKILFFIQINKSFFYLFFSTERSFLLMSRLSIVFGVSESFFFSPGSGVKNKKKILHRFSMNQNYLIQIDGKNFRSCRELFFKFFFKNLFKNIFDLVFEAPALASFSTPTINPPSHLHPSNIQQPIS